MTDRESQSFDAVILCGGKGSRLRSVVSDRPKSMALLRGRPFLEWQLMALQEAGFRRVVLCTGYMGSSIRHHFGDGEDAGLHIRYSDEHKAMGTGGALRRALHLIQSDSVLVLNGDSWCDVDMTDLLHFHNTQEAMGTLTLTTVAQPQRYGQVMLDGSGNIVGFLEKAKTVSSGWINAGMYVLSQALIESIPQQTFISLEYDVFPDWVGKGLYGYSGEHRFFDIGTPVSYAQAEQDFQQVFHRVPTECHGMRQTA